MTLAELIADIIRQFKEASLDTPDLDARWLVGHALSMDRTGLFTEANRILTTDERTDIMKLVERRLRSEPVGRIIGMREFWGLPFKLNEATLEPRPDSELLVETALTYSKPDAAFRILDLGTGTGCLLLSLLHARPLASGMGIDRAPRAVEQARANAEALGLSSRAGFHCGDWFSGVAETFDLIVSNPPYIPQLDIGELMPDVRDYDPLLALDGGPDGLLPFRILVPNIHRFLNASGRVIFEVGINQAAMVAGLLRQAGLENIATYWDLNGVERCVSAQKP